MASTNDTVGDLLGIDMTDEPVVYRLGSEPAELPPPRPPRRRASPLDRTKVAPFYEAVCLGIPDADVARVAGVTVAQARGWRLRLGIKRRRGSCAVAKIHGAMLSTPALAGVLRDLSRRDGLDPPAPVRVDYDELEPLLEAAGLRLRWTNSKEHRSHVGRRAT